MMHDSDLVEHCSQTSIKTMTVILAGTQLDMFHGDSTLVIYAFVNAE